MIYVTCQDGRRRHSRGFDDPEDAVQFAQWGHCCTNTHTYTTDDPIYDEVPTPEDEERVGAAEPEPSIAR